MFVDNGRFVSAPTPAAVSVSSKDSTRPPSDTERILFDKVKVALASKAGFLSVFTSKKVLCINALKALMIEASEDELVECGLTGDMLLDAELLPDLLLTQDLSTLAVTADAARVRRAKDIEKEISRLLPKKDIIGPKAWAALNAARSRPDTIAEVRPSINQKDSFGNTPLHRACRDGNLQLAATLLLAGADINARNSNNDTPLHLASFNGYLDTVRLLLEWGGVEVNARDSRGDTPLGYAIRRGHSEIAALLRAKGATE